MRNRQCGVKAERLTGSMKIVNNHFINFERLLVELATEMLSVSCASF